MTEVLISRIYDCALQPRLWPDVLQDIAQLAGAFGAMVFDCEIDGAGERVNLQICSSIYDPQIVAAYIAVQNACELRDQARFALLSSAGDEVNLIRCDDLFSSRAELENQPNMQAMMQMGIYHRAGALLCKDTANLDRFALQFRKSHGALTEANRQKIQALLPHVAKALSIGRSFRAVQDLNLSLTAALDRLPFGVAILRGNGDLIFHNPHFAQLGKKFGLIAAGQAGKANVTCFPENMRALFRGASHHGKFGARPLREAAFVKGAQADMGLFIEASPVTAHPEFERFGADSYLVSLLDSQCAHLIDTSVLRRYFSMTEAEMAVLDLVVQGHTNAEIAQVRGRSLETVNSQTKALIAKSGTRNRTELVRMAVSLSAASMGKNTKG